MTLNERIVKLFKNKISQCKIAKNLGLSPSTIHNIVKQFRESGEISVKKDRTSLLNMCNFQAQDGTV